MTALGAPLLTKTVHCGCDGQCGGVVHLTTDEVHVAYAETTDCDNGTVYHGYAGQEAAVVVKQADGSITVSCGATQPEAGLTCDGEVTFTKAHLNAVRWTPATVTGMEPMEGPS